MLKLSNYYVWRRSDGYVGCTARNRPPGPIAEFTFDVLLVTTEWPEARERLLAERDEAHYTIVRSWET